MSGVPSSEVAHPFLSSAPHEGCSVEDRLIRSVVFGCCVTETANCARFVDALDPMTNPFLRDVTRQLLFDEATHAQFGFYFLEARRPYLDANPEVRKSVARCLAFAFAVLDDEYRVPSPPLDDEGRSLGLPHGPHTHEIFRVTMEAAVIPGLERFGISAGEAWIRRSRS